MAGMQMPHGMQMQHPGMMMAGMQIPHGMHLAGMAPNGMPVFQMAPVHLLQPPGQAGYGPIKTNGRQQEDHNGMMPREEFPMKYIENVGGRIAR